MLLNIRFTQAWQSGSDAAKEYGVVLSDNVLRGWMSEQGIDATREMSDAMMQSYRYQLMQEQLNADNGATMQDNIKRWSELGDQINQAKQSLFSFDEVINMTSKDTSIPTIGAPAALDISGLTGAQGAGFDTEGILGILVALVGAAGAIAALMKLLDMLKNWKTAKLIDTALLTLLPSLLSGIFTSIPKTVKIVPVVETSSVNAFKKESGEDFPWTISLATETDSKAVDEHEKYLSDTFPYSAMVTAGVDGEVLDDFVKHLNATFPYTASIITAVDTSQLQSTISLLSSLFPYTAYVDVVVNDASVDTLLAKLQAATIQVDGIGSTPSTVTPPTLLLRVVEAQAGVHRLHARQEAHVAARPP